MCESEDTFGPGSGDHYSCQPEGEGVAEGQPEGVEEGEGVAEGQPEGVEEGEGVAEGQPEGVEEGEGVAEGQPEGVEEGEGVAEGQPEGVEEGEGVAEGQPEGVEEGEGEGGIVTETILLPGDLPLEMVWLPAGSFLMGRYSGEQDSSTDEDPQHTVTFSQGFWMAKYELTHAQWTAVMGTTPWDGHDYILADANAPAVFVSWDHAQSFVTALNTWTGLAFRLPSEAEWEYADRAGTTTRFYWGDDPEYASVNQYTWNYYNTWEAIEEYAHLTGQKLPNAWGLFDMNGNVSEWCQDWYHSRYSGAPNDGSAWEYPVGAKRVVRGCNWSSGSYVLRSAYRSYSVPATANENIGFRVAR